MFYMNSTGFLIYSLFVYTLVYYSQHSSLSINIFQKNTESKIPSVLQFLLRFSPSFSMLIKQAAL